MIGAFWTAARDWRTWAALALMGAAGTLMILTCSVVGQP